MNLSSIMGKQVAELQHTLSMNLLKSQMSTQTAQVTAMLEKMNSSQPAPHPSKGHTVDIKG
ncbi:putative motility protein [Rossellomorea aquimaris]|uniref:putative motility protein n=1 Tax=Rossellomorea aquimaris TaxID=189382 RepID=UPI0007D08D9F|nr:putative motility protein [Rossellomorea aquimaris]